MREETGHLSSNFLSQLPHTQHAESSSARSSASSRVAAVSGTSTIGTKARENEAAVRLGLSGLVGDPEEDDDDGMELDGDQGQFNHQYVDHRQSVSSLCSVY